MIWVADAREGWRARSVVLDGLEIGARTQSIEFDGEQPVALHLFTLDQHGRVGVIGADGALVTERVAGLISVEGFQLREHA